VAAQDSNFGFMGWVVAVGLFVFILIKYFYTYRHNSEEISVPTLPENTISHEQEGNARRESREHFVAPQRRRQDLIVILKSLKKGAADVQIFCPASEDQPFASAISELFIIAGWTSKVSAPQDQFLPHFDDVCTVYVRGWNSQLVDAVAHAFERAGILGVKGITEREDTANHDDPRWQLEQHSIRVSIGN
jgi:hypothetical protein